MTIRTRRWDRLGHGGLTFTELGFGTAPIGDLSRASTSPGRSSAIC